MKFSGNLPDILKDVNHLCPSQGSFSVV